MVKYIVCLLVIWNIITFFMMGIDKRRAVHDRRRISEKTLLGSAFLMGGVGIFAGSRVYRHKTKKTKFIIGMPLAVLFNIAIIIGAIYLFR